ncbi:HupE/UreJ family protein [Pendulispora rubella]|uniref:HupE/UreJ family protein n=1 Tax=Pendulispora rubella TaxID=2741070 RepID=UPI00374E1A16
MQRSFRDSEFDVRLGPGIGPPGNPHRVLDPSGPSVGHVFRPSTEELWLDRTASSSGETWTAFVAQGVHHILTGFDHLAFVISLVLVVTSLRELALVITSFTLAHSITLALGALDIVCPPAAFIEPTICVTILFVAIENLILARGVSLPSLRWRPTLTFAFGLIHGFGFSNQLRELGLRAHGLAKTLVAFNLGVELGQLLVVLPLFFALGYIVKWFTNPSRAKRRIVFGTSGIVAALALVWLTERITDTHILPFG